MHNLLAKRWEKRAQGDKGFTLIELLVVVVILGVLIAIAIPLYLNYRKGANDASAQSDMRNAINVLEQCNTDNGKYPTSDFLLNATGTVGNGCTVTTQTINLSNGTSLQYKAAASATGASYVIVDNNSNGGGKFYCYNSLKGGQVTPMTTPPAAVTAATLTSC